MNNFSVTIGGLAYKNAVFPLKYEDLLDEQLNSAVLGLTRVSTPYFKPATPVFITITSKNLARDVEYNQTKTLEYVISNDRSIESPVGSGFYRHEITLIEPTKLLEVPLESLCFRNAGGRNFAVNAVTPTVTVTKNEDNVSIEPTLPNILTPTAEKTITLPSLKEFTGLGSGFSVWGTIVIQNTNGEETVYEFSSSTSNQDLTITANDSTIKVYYNITQRTTGVPISYDYEANFSIAFVENKLPLAPYSIQEVIDRVLELQDPLVYSSVTNGLHYQQRFKFDLSKIPAEKQELFTRRNAPEFTFTRCTLREALQIIGGYIHAEPKLLYNAETGEFDTITFDFYGLEEYAEYYDVLYKEIRRLSDYKYEDKTLSWNIEQGCNELDAYVENLVNRINAGSSTTAQPFKGGYQTLRMETAYVRYEDEEGALYFPTDYPIHEIKGFYWYYNGTKYDITPYIYEKNIYDSQLSSYEETYPISKSYGLYYTLGEKGIKGFFFKNEKLSGPFADYAIINILRAAAGNSVWLPENMEQYLSLQFQLEYTPIYSARIKHSKTYVDEWLPQPRTLNYSQSDNMVETQYFGENIKGAVERYGTLEKLITFVCRNIETIPKAGLKFDDDYYIATVSVEVIQDRFKVTCGLSKRFNRLSKYVGVSSYKRIYEVSERMTQTRENVWTDYVVFADKDTYFLSTAPFNSIFWEYMQSTFIRTSYVYNPVGGCRLQGFTKTFAPLNAVLLPVIASAEGNTIELSCAYKDNFSAGQRKVIFDDAEYSSEVEYADYYGRLYYLQWAYGYFGNFSFDENSTADNLPYAPNETVISPPISIQNNLYQILRKDGAEAIKHNVCIQMVADNKRIVIGSALARSNPLVIGKSTKGAKFVVLKNPLSVFTSIIPESEIREVIDITSKNFEFIADKNGNSVGLVFNPPTNQYSAKYIQGNAWALITPRTSEEKTYSTEDGETITITETSGGELLIGKNERIDASPNVSSISDEKKKIGTGFMAFGCHNIYEWLKQKNK